MAECNPTFPRVTFLRGLQHWLVKKFKFYFGSFDIKCAVRVLIDVGVVRTK